MTELWAAIALLLCLTSGFVLWAWWRPLPISAASNNRNDAVVELYRVKQSELEHELASAQINRSDYDQALAEMQRTLLLETSASLTPKSSSNHAGGLLLLLVALVIPVAGLLTYTQLGAYGSLEQNVNLKNTRSLAASAPSVTALISSLEDELKQRIGPLVSRWARKYSRSPEDVNRFIKRSFNKARSHMTITELKLVEAFALEADGDPFIH